MNNKRIILVGASAAGKSYIREKFREKGFKCDVSYTSREPREGEINGIDYNFISDDEFTLRISEGAFYEHVQYNDNCYGTGLYEWNNCDVFIMETDGISKIKPKDRQDCLVIYVNTPFETRLNRMRDRGWSNEKISERVVTDNLKFSYFTDYDLEISSEAHN